MKQLYALCLLAMVSVAQAQPTLRIGADTRVVGSGAVRLVYDGGTLTNNGTLSLPVGTSLIASGATTYGGSGAATVAQVTFRHTTGTSTLNSLLSVTGRATLAANAALNANGQLYLRTDQNPNADLLNEGVLTGTVQGLLTKATLTTGAVPYTSTLATNVAGSVMRYQWQQSATGSTWTDVPNATGATYAASVSAPTYYRCRLTTTNSTYLQTTPARLLDYTGTPASQRVCRGSRVVLTATLTGTRYEWYRGNQGAAARLIDVRSIQTGTTTNSLTLVSVQTNATYQAKVFAANGSFQWSGPFVVEVNGGCVAPGARLAAGGEPVTPLTVRLLPNPLEAGRLRATIWGAGGGPLHVQATNLAGYVVAEQQWPSANHEHTLDWDLNAQPGGVYLLQVRTPGQTQTVRVLKP